MIKETACLLMLLCCVLSAAEEQWVVSSHGMDVPFSSWQAEGAKADTGVLVLVPGYNGKGEQMLDARWKAFAAKNGLVLLAPTFHAEGKENNEGKGYYYPKQGSGDLTVPSSPSSRSSSETFLWDGLALLRRSDTIYVIESHPSGGIPIASHPVGKPEEVTYHLHDLLGTTLATVGPAGVNFSRLTSFGQPLKAAPGGGSPGTAAPSSPANPVPNNNQLPPTKR